jgi:hypothetical protein
MHLEQVVYIQAPICLSAYFISVVTEKCSVTFVFGVSLMSQGDCSPYFRLAPLILKYGSLCEIHMLFETFYIFVNI